MRPTILLDVDGVLANFTQRTLDLVFQTTGRRHDPSAVTTWEIFDSLPESQWVQDVTYKTMKGPGGCVSIPLYEGAQEGVRKLRELGDIVIVTSPFTGSPTWTHEREVWLKMHFGIDPHDVIHAKNKARIHGDFLIDDKPSHVEDWLKYWDGASKGRDNRRGILWATDRTIHAPTDLRMAKSWDDVYKTIREVA